MFVVDCVYIILLLVHYNYFQWAKLIYIYIYSFMTYVDVIIILVKDVIREILRVKWVRNFNAVTKKEIVILFCPPKCVPSFWAYAFVSWLSSYVILWICWPTLGIHLVNMIVIVRLRSKDWDFDAYFVFKEINK